MEIDDHGSFAGFAANVRTQARNIQPAMNAAIEQGLRETRRAVAHRAATILPRKGGLAARVAQLDLRVVPTKHGAKLTAHSRYDIKSIDAGIVHHLVYGHRPLVTQRVRPGFWSAPTGASGTDLKADIAKAVSAILAKV